MTREPARRRPRALRRTPALLVLLALAFVISGPAGARPAPPASRTGWFVDMNRFAKSAHAALPCAECHGAMTENGRPHPDADSPDFLLTPASQRYDYARCGRCHRLSLERYGMGGHAKARSEAVQADPSTRSAAEGKRRAPTCGDCHASHYERSGLSRLEVGARMVDTCRGCHPAHTQSYLANIHGRTGVDLKSPGSAFCTDCHGAHTVQSLKTADQALPVCRRCHPDATAEFTRSVIHASPENLAGEASEKSGAILWIHRVKIAAVALVAISLVFFFGHGFLWVLREMHEKLRKH